jgi:transcriptional regulator with XRE-family HTH domain
MQSTILCVKSIIYDIVNAIFIYKRSNMIINDLSVVSDSKVLETLAEGFRRERLSRNLTQQSLADMSGIGVATLRRFERGEGNMSMLNMIALMRALDIVERLSALFPDSDIKPMANLREQGAGIYAEKPTRQRASGRQDDISEKGRWEWGDDA